MTDKKTSYPSTLLLLLVALVVAGACVSCSRSRQQGRILSEAESAYENPDSALAILETIDPGELTQDSLRARYYYLTAFMHDRLDRIALSDSMLGFAADYYRDRNLGRSIRCATLLASYKFRLGERERALRMLDSLSSLTDVPESLLIEPLRYRVDLGKYYGPNESRLNRLLAIDKDKSRHTQYRNLLYFDLLFSGKNDSAPVILDEFIDMAARDGDPEKKFHYVYEKIGLLHELGRYDESIYLADSLMNDPIGYPVRHYFHLWKSIGLLNKHDYVAAAGELAAADSCATAVPADDRGYYNSFAYVLHTVLDFQRTGKVSLIPFARINNSQRDNLVDEQHLRQEAVNHALEVENKRLILKAENDRQTALIIIIVLLALLVSALLLWYARNKKRKTMEVMERNEILQKLVEESKATKTDAAFTDTLRRAMLKQLGIIKMVAEAPTEQNRDMLRKISSIENGSDDGSLVNWESVYEIIDSLYDGFYSRMHERHGSALTDKEERIIALMAAGFSTKEISVITGQTVATIYVRKSSVRKKLGVAEKEDIVAFLRREGRA